MLEINSYLVVLIFYTSKRPKVESKYTMKTFVPGNNSLASSSEKGFLGQCDFLKMYLFIYVLLQSLEQPLGEVGAE